MNSATQPADEVAKDESPDTPEDIENMLRREREPILGDLLNQEYARTSQYSEPQVSIGMPKRYVQMQLGVPAQVEVAGNPDYGNERWTYEASMPTSNGYITQRRYIYFENHQVVGWEIE